VPEASGIYAYVAVFVGLLCAGMGFPIPEEIPVVTGGGWCAHAAAQQPPAHPIWWIMLPVCIIGVVVSDGILYTIGRHGGTRLLEIGWVKRHMVRPDKRAKIEHNFQKYGIKILLGARLLPGIRAPIFVMAGVMRLPVRRFLLADGIYAIPGVTLLFTLAYWFFDQVWEIVHNLEQRVGSMRPYLIIAVLAAVGCFLLYEYLKRRVVTGDPKEVPLIGEKVIRPPTPHADKSGSWMVAPVAEQQQAEAQLEARKKVQQQPSK
jgi:membrane protein DedA with SNARE-associated domain